MKIMALALWSVFVSGISLIGYHHFYASDFAVIQMDTLIQQQARFMAQHQLDPEQSASQFSAHLQTQLQALHKQGTIVFIQPAVLTPLPDFTQAMQQQIAKAQGIEEGK